MAPAKRSLLHAASLLALLGVLAFFSFPVAVPSLGWLGPLNPAHWAGCLDLPPKAPFAAFQGYGHELLLDIGIAITLAVSLNLILGMAGQFSLGHAGFAAAGAFTAALVAGRYFPGPLYFLTQGPLHFSTGFAFQLILLMAMAAGGLVAAILGLLVGLPTLRLRGDYLAIATLGFGEILAVIFQNFQVNGRGYFGGSLGLMLGGMRSEWAADQPDMDAPLVKSVTDYMDYTQYTVGAFAVFAVALITIYIVHNIKFATSGRALLALREDPIASESVGVPTTRYKVAAFVIGATLAGIAGALIAHHKPLVNSESFRFMRSIEIVAMVILGGQGSITGSVLAAIVLTLMPEALRSYVQPWTVGGLHWIHLESASLWVKSLDMDKWRMVLYSLFIILAMLFRPQGLFGRYEISDLVRWVVSKTKRRGFPTDAPHVAKMAMAAVATPVAPAKVGTEPPSVQMVVSHVTMQFGGLKAVDDFCLTLGAGELVGLIGPNGAGKTTVFNVLTGVYRPTSGSIVLGKRSIVRLKPHVISHRGVARTFQNIRLFGNLSVIDNVQIAQHAHHKQGIPAAILRTPAFYREEAASRVSAMGYLELFKLADLAEERASSLSYGDQRRLEIARALATRPKILLLDEPAAGMNPTEKRELMDMIRSLRTRFGLTILLIEHDMKVIMGVCERILVLDYGKTIAMGTPEEIRKDPAVVRAYLGTK